MAINVQSTSTISTNGVKVLVYGQAGAGKTTLIKTMPAPIILSAEGGLLALAQEDIPYIEIKTMADLADAFNWLNQSDEAKQYHSVALDSISEIAEVVLGVEKEQVKDPRQAYGEMQDQMTKLIRSFRDLPGRNVYFSAKLEKQEDELGRLLNSPSMPGRKLGPALSYFFDEVFALRIGPDTDGKIKRMLQCTSDGLWTAKDRSGRLEAWEPADLGAVFGKIGGATTDAD